MKNNTKDNFIHQQNQCGSQRKTIVVSKLWGSNITEKTEMQKFPALFDIRCVLHLLNDLFRT